MKALFSNFLTHKSLFFEQFDLASKNLVEMATMLSALVETGDPARTEVIYGQMDKKENFGGDITHKIHLYLNKVLFPPLNRPDIHALATAMDYVNDAIHDAGVRIYLYDLREFSPAIKQLVAIILNASLQIEKAISLLRSAKNSEAIGLLCRHVKNDKDQALQIYYRAVAGILPDKKNVINMLKYREILFSMETAVNKCKNVTNILNTILISN